MSSKHFMMIQKFLPVNASQTTVHYEIYRHKDSSSEDFHLIADMYARVMKEDKALCDIAQRNLHRGNYVSGELHPRWEKGPLHFQQQVREALTEHHAREKREGSEIWPARQVIPGDDRAAQEDEELCNGLRCDSQKNELVW
jgi:phenylpropionate dioxygenase-like ring-hydroxylating dioxygenase large terminal subunit